MEVEEQFDIRVPEEVADSIKTVDDTVNGVTQCIDRTEGISERQ